MQLREVLQRVALALGGRPEARLSGGIASAVSRMTLLQLIRVFPELETGKLVAWMLKVIGVDEWAFRKERNYGTTLADMAPAARSTCCRRPPPDAFGTWLEQHPGDLPGTARYLPTALGVVLPDAIQVADRWQCGASRAE